MTNFEKSGDDQDRAEQQSPSSQPPPASGYPQGPPSSPPPAGSYPQEQGGYSPDQGGYQQGQGGYQQGQGGYSPGQGGYQQGPPPSGYQAGPPPGYPQGQPQAYSYSPPGYGSNMPPPPYYPQSGVEGFPMLPPGVEPASHGRRIGAYFLAIPLAIVTLGIGYLIWGLVLWNKGTSPALRLLGMRCVNSTTGQPAGFGTMALRDIVGSIAQGILSIITLLVSFIMFLATAKRQSLPDVIGSTVVVYDPNKVLDVQR